MKRIWWIIGVCCRTIIAVFCVVVVVAFFLPFFASLPLNDFSDVDGVNAKSRIRHLWPEDIATSDVQKASGQEYSQIDCSVRWYKITLARNVAETWQDTIHAELEKSLQSRKDSYESLEGVNRTVNAPTLPKSSLGNPPTWWKPPYIDFRVTESMRWHSGANNADALYSAFDPATKILWIFKYSQQHGQLWAKGDAPPGEPFGGVNQIPGTPGI